MDQISMFGVNSYKLEEERKTALSIAEEIHHRAEEDYKNGLPGPYAPAPVVFEERHIKALETLTELSQDGHFWLYMTRHWVKVNKDVFLHSADRETAEWDSGGAWGKNGTVIIRCEDIGSERVFKDWKEGEHAGKVSPGGAVE